MDDQPIDVVVTWVDGHDPNHSRKLKHHLQQMNLPQAAADPTRFNQCGELDYCIRAWFAHAPWIRFLFIVTDAQIPRIYQRLRDTPFADRVHCIDHRDMFRGFESYLPTFNSVSIESMLWRIEALSEQFIYCNDDCFVIRPVSKTDFFRGDQVVVRGDWKVQSHQKWLHKIQANLFCRTPPVSDHRLIQEKSATCAGFDRLFLHLPHAPFALNRETFKCFFQENEAVLLNNICHRLRSQEQLWPISLAQHLMLKSGQAILEPQPTTVMVNPAFHLYRTINKRLMQVQQDTSMMFLCIQSLDQASMSLQHELVRFLEQRIPNPLVDLNGVL